MRIGYYIFLGYGDYHPVTSGSQNWVNSWDLERWKSFVDEIKELGVNTIMIYLNGHELPYQSKKYPELIDLQHPNNKKEFLKELLIYIKDKGIEVIGVITTTGHAGKFSRLHSASAIQIANPDTSIEMTLSPFPDHLKKNKLAKKEGAAQLGYGVLCHNNKNSQQYAEDILGELIESYGVYFDGIALHPPESAYPCSCDVCQKKFLLESSLNLLDVSPEVARHFFISSYLDFQNKILFPLIEKAKPRCNLLLFTIPWLFESSFKELNTLVPRGITIIEWDYNLDPKRIGGLHDRLKNYMSLGNQVWFMPTGGFSFDPQGSIEDQINSVFEQIEISENVGVQGIVHFLGPQSSKFLKAISVRSYLESKQNNLTIRF